MGDPYLSYYFNFPIYLSVLRLTSVTLEYFKSMNLIRALLLQGCACKTGDIGNSQFLSKRKILFRKCCDYNS